MELSISKKINEKNVYFAKIAPNKFDPLKSQFNITLAMAKALVDHIEKDGKDWKDNKGVLQRSVYLNVYDNSKPAGSHTVEKGNAYQPQPDLDDEIPFN